jgi:hypothetical protein
MPAASTRPESPRAAWIDPCPVDLGNAWTGATGVEELRDPQELEVDVEVPVSAAAVSSALLRSRVPAPAAVELAFLIEPAVDVRAYLT